MVLAVALIIFVVEESSVKLVVYLPFFFLPAAFTAHLISSIVISGANHVKIINYTNVQIAIDLNFF